jgi:hypothetical protein
MHFDTKIYLKSNHNHTAKQTLHQYLSFMGESFPTTHNLLWIITVIYNIFFLLNFPFFSKLFFFNIIFFLFFLFIFLKKIIFVDFTF